MDPKYVKQAQEIAQRCMADAMYDGHMDWLSDPRLRTPEQLEAESVAKDRAATAGLTIAAYDAEIAKRSEKVKALQKQIRKSARAKVGSK